MTETFRSVGFNRLTRGVLLLIFACAQAFALPAAAHATTYYVSVVGTDTATGLLGYPLATVDKELPRPM